MKSVFIYVLTLCMIFSSTITSNAQSIEEKEEEKEVIIELTDEQVRMLNEYYNLSITKNTKISSEELRKILLSPIKSQDSQVSDNRIANQTQKDLTEQLALKGISFNQYDFLRDLGVNHDTIMKMSYSEINKAVPVRKSSLRIAIPNAINPTAIDVPQYDGTFDYDEYYAWRVGATESNISSTVLAAKHAATTVFRTSLYLDYSYYLWGEWGERYDNDYAIHEGVDFQKENASGNVIVANVYCSTPNAYVTRADSVGFNVWDPILGVTINYQHLSNLQYAVGDTIPYGAFIGQQNLSDRHVHIQVCDDYKCKKVHTGFDTEMTLVCDSPYGVLIFHNPWN